MEFQSKRQLQDTFNLTHSELRKIIEKNNLEPVFQKGRGTYFEVDAIKIYIEKYLESKKKYKTLHEMTEIYKVSSTKIYNLVLKHKLVPTYVQGKNKFYNLEEIDLLIKKDSEKQDPTNFLSTHALTEKFEIGCSKTTKEILDFHGILPTYQTGYASYYDVREVTPILEVFKRSKSPNELAGIYQISVGTINKLIKHYTIPSSYTTQKGGIHYYDVDKVEPLIQELRYAQENWKTVRQIHKKYNIHQNILEDAIEKFNIQAKYVRYSGWRYFDEQEVLNAYQQRIEIIERERKGTYETFYDQLHPDLQKIIDDYIDIRLDGTVIRSSFYKSSKRTISHEEKEIPRIRRTIASTLYKIAVYRLGKIGEKVMRQVYFDLTTLNPDDITPLREAFSNSTLFNTRTVLAPFLSFLLQQEKRKARKNKNMDDYDIFEECAVEFLDKFPLNYKDGKKLPNEIVKSFLTREQCIEVYELLISDPRSSLSLKYATIWKMSCITGIRPEELCLLRINDFLLDDSGFLKTNKLGWGWVYVRREISKMEQCPSSHEECKTPIPENLVNDINNYLCWLYQKQGRLIEKGRGYLFRPRPQLPETSHTSSLGTKAFKRIVKFLDFLTYEQQRDFQIKTGRHSLNTMFVEAVDVIPEKLKNWKLERVRQHQMRHKGDKHTEEIQKVQQAKTGRNHYTKDITAEEYYGTLDYVITYPWDKRELILWEIEKGYRDPETDIDINIDFKNELEKNSFEGIIEGEKRKKQQVKEEIKQKKDDTSNKLLEKLKLIEDRLFEIKQAPNDDQAFEGWLKERATLEKDKKEITVYLEKSS